MRKNIMRNRKNIRKYLYENINSNFLREEDVTFSGDMNNLPSASFVASLYNVVSSGDRETVKRMVKAAKNQISHVVDTSQYDNETPVRPFPDMAQYDNETPVRPLPDMAQYDNETIVPKIQEESQGILQRTIEIFKGFIESTGSGFHWIWETVYGAFTKAAEYLGSSIRKLFNMPYSTVGDDKKTPPDMAQYDNDNESITRPNNPIYSPLNDPTSLESCILYALAASSLAIIGFVVYKIIKWIKSKRETTVNDVSEMYVIKTSEIYNLQESTFRFLKMNLREDTLETINDELENMIQDNVELEKEVQGNTDDSIMSKIKRFFSKYFSWILLFIVLSGVGALFYANFDSIKEALGFGPSITQQNLANAAIKAKDHDSLDSLKTAQANAKFGHDSVINKIDFDSIKPEPTPPSMNSAMRN